VQRDVGAFISRAHRYVTRVLISLHGVQMLRVHVEETGEAVIKSKVAVMQVSLRYALVYMSRARNYVTPLT
jgi:hypothetical protein